MKRKNKKGLFKRLSSIDDIKENFILTKNLLKNKSKENKKTYVKESFEQALQRLSIRKDDEESKLTSVYNKLKLEFFSYFTSSFLIFLLTTYQIMTMDNVGYIYYASYLISTALFIMALGKSLRCYQIRKRELGGLKIFLTKPKEWYPKKYIYKGAK